MPDTLVSIGNYAFQGSKLTAVDIPDSVTSLGVNAFNCYLLKSVRLSNNLTALPYAAFYSTSIETLFIPFSVTNIDSIAIRTTTMKRVYIKNGLCSVYNNNYDYTGSNAVFYVPAGSSLASILPNCIEAVDITDIQMSQSEAQLNKNETVQLTASVTPTEASVMPITWSSSNTAVATVDSDGLVKAISCGEAVITASEAWSGKTASCTVRMEHDIIYSQVRVPATCTEDGVMDVTCANCSITSEVIPATGHLWGEWVYDAQTKTHTKTCANDASHTETVDCTFDSGVVTTEPTCTAEGTRTFTCTVCDGTYTAPVPVMGHAWTAWTYDAATRTHSRYCANNTLHIQSAGCTFNSGVVTTAPTCTEEGIRTFSCIVCGGTYTAPEPATGHRWGAWSACGDGTHVRSCLNDSAHKDYASCSYTSIVVAPTCEAQGYTVHKCTVCSYRYNDTYTPKTRHTYGAWVTNNNGTHTRTCTNANDSDETADCTYALTETPPTCTASGYTTYTCTGCGYTYISDVTNATGHAYGAWISENNGYHTRVCANDETHTQRAECSYTEAVTPPTCTSQGYTTHTCTGCGYAYTDTTVTATGHNYSDWLSNGNGTHGRFCRNNPEERQTSACSYSFSVVAPTCTKDGYTEYTCTVCGYSYRADYTDKINHAYGEWSENGNGTHTRVCANDASHTETVECTFVDSVTLPTCTTPGYTTRTCSVCGYTYKTAATAALRHNYSVWRSNNDGTHTGICANDASHTTTSGCTYRTTIVAPTCTEKGYIKNTCTLCGYETIEYTAPATGHNYGVITTNGDGTHKKTCTKDVSHTLVESCTYDVSVISPTCTEQGYTLYSCQSCTYKYKTDYTAPTGHNWATYINLGNGTHQAVCANDLTHTKIEACYDSSPVEEAADCTHGIKVVSTCECCGYESFTVRAGTETGHDFVRDTLRDIAPTRNTAGREAYTCTRCGASNDVALPALSTWHIPVTSITVSSAKALYCTGESTALTATVLPSNASYKGVEWTSSDTSVATVDATGKVTWLSRGSVTFTATSVDPYGTISGSTTIAGGYSSPSYTVSFEVVGNCSYTVDGTVYTESGFSSVAAGTDFTFLVNNARVAVEGAEISAVSSSAYRIYDIHGNVTIIITSNTVTAPKEDTQSSGGSFFDKIAEFFNKLFSMIAALFGG